MKTAKEISDEAWGLWADYYQEGEKMSKEILEEIESKIIDFAKSHVTEVLKEASEKAKISKTACGDSMSCGCMGNCEYPTSFVNKRSILTAYSLDKVE